MVVRMSRSREAPGWVHVHDCDRCGSSSECLSRFRPVARALGSSSVPGLREWCRWWFVRYQLEARRASNARPLKLSLPCLRLHVRRNHTSLFKVASVYGKQCQAHTHGVGRTLGLRSGGASDSFSKTYVTPANVIICTNFT